MHNLVDAFSPSVAILDPISNFTSMGTTADVYAALMRLIDFLKHRQVTCILCTSLTEAGTVIEQTTVGFPR
jgi:circadian clock protein KaiC